MMTEDEAKQRWCPLVRFKSGNTGSETAFNRQRGYDETAADLNCIGSRCMAWHWRSASLDEDLGYCGAFGGQSNG